MRLSRGGTTQSTLNLGDVTVVLSWISELRLSFLLGLTLAALPSFAVRVADSPKLPQRAATLAGFVAPGWVIEQQLAGDFNRDGRADALILLRKAPATTQPDTNGANGAADFPHDSSAVRRSAPRVFAVLLGARNGYALSASNGRLVPQVDLANQEDPMADGELMVKPGGFEIKLGMTAGVGSYLSAMVRYRFRHQNGCLRLIGYDRLETHRATLDTQDLSVNFLTGTVVHTSGNAQSDASRIRRERLATNPRRCLQDLHSAVDFKPF